MTDQEIAEAVQKIVRAIPHDTQHPPAASEVAAVASGAALLTNFLQNINAIAKTGKQP